MKTNETSKKTQSLFRTIGLTLALLTAFGNRTALAQTDYIDENGTTQQATTVTVLTGSETSLSNGWYLASGTLVYNTTLTVSGDVHLILEDGCVMTVTGGANDAGINVSGTNSLTIYAQPIATSAGSLSASGGGGNGGAGIGGANGDSGGNITICGGHISATGSGGAAGIGGGNNGDSGNILIFGENTTVYAAGSNAGDNIGAGNGGAKNSIFIALPDGKLSYLNSSQTAVFMLNFTANPASTGILSATLSVSVNGISTLPLLTGLDITGKNMRIYSTSDVSFKLNDTGYLNNPVTEPATLLNNGGSTNIFFYQSETDCGLIFDAGTGKFYLDNGSSIGPGNTYTGQSGKWSWDRIHRTLSLNGFSWTTTASVALGILDLNAPGGNPLGSSLTLNLAGTNTFTSKNNTASNSTGVLALIGQLTIEGSGQLSVRGENASPTGLFALGDLIISGGTVNASAESSGAAMSSIGMQITGNLTVSGGALNVTGKNGKPIGLDCYADYTQTGGTVNANAVSSDAASISWGMMTIGNLTVSGGALNATGSGTDACIGLAGSAAYTQTGGTVTASASNTYSTAYGMWFDPGDKLEISGGTLSASAGRATGPDGNSFGIYIANGNPFTFAGGTVTAAGYFTALVADFNITAPYYTYWTNKVSPYHPGGPGKAVPPDAGYTSPTSFPLDLFVELKEMFVPSLTLTATGGTYSNNSITLTATVGAGVQGQAYKPAPTGTVTFMEGETILGAKTLNRYGTATFTLASPVAPGSYAFTAYYDGDDNYFDAVSDTCTVDVDPFLSVAPTALHFDAQGGTQAVAIDCTSGWSLNCDAPWLTTSVSEAESTDTHIILNATAAANPDATQRKALITVSLPGIFIKTVSVTQDAAAEVKTALKLTDASSVIVYSQAGNAIVKSDAPIQSVAVYDVAGRLLKEVKGGSALIEITGLPKEQMLIVKVVLNANDAKDANIRKYKLIII